MPNSVIEPFSVLASLQAGPPGKLRLSLDYPNGGIIRGLLGSFHLPARWRHHTTGASVVEIDRGKLQRLEFSQQELAEIGFSLVTMLGVLERCRTKVEEE